MSNTDRSVEEIAKEVIYKTFNTREASTCDHCERRYDDSICETCFRIKLFEKTKEALTTERRACESWKKKAEEAIKLGSSQAEEMDKFWSAIGCLSKDITVDDAIFKWLEMKEKTQKIELAIIGLQKYGMHHRKCQYIPIEGLGLSNDCTCGFHKLISQLKS